MTQPDRRTALRWLIALIAVMHGVIHLMGTVKGFGWADVSELNEPIGTVTGGVWLLAAVLVVIAGIGLLAQVQRWWVVAAVAAVVSQAVIFTSWSDAKAGSAANVILALAAGYGFRSQGPTSFRAKFRQLARQTTTSASPVNGPAFDHLEFHVNNITYLEVDATGRKPLRANADATH
jgi:hypothetical protein